MKSLEAYEKPLVNTLDKIEEELKVAASTVDAVKLVDLINAEKKGCQDVVNDLKDVKRRVSAEKRSQGINKPRKAAVAEEVPVESDSEGSQSAQGRVTIFQVPVFGLSFKHLPARFIVLLVTQCFICRMYDVWFFIVTQH